MNAAFQIQNARLETPRLILRPFRKEDLDDFYEYASVEGVGEMAGWKHHVSKEESEEVLSLFIESDVIFAICLKETGKVIGSIGVDPYELEEKLTEFAPYQGRKLGFALSKAYWGQGLMPEAVFAVIQYLFQERDLDFLLCGHYAFNTQSARVQEKLGFEPYRQLLLDTQMGTQEPGYLTLMTNPKKKITLEFSHPETLIYRNASRS